MKTIGLLGGMGWPSSTIYYRLLNQRIQQRLGGQHSARCVLLSVDFAEIEKLQASNDWDRAGQLLSQEARRLDAAGADILLLATNSMHRVANTIETASRSRFLHIADALGRALVERNIQRIGLLGTRYTMEADFYSGRLASHFGVETLIPEASDRQELHRIIYDELVHEQIRVESRALYLNVVERLAKRGAQAVALACTEIGLLLRDKDAAVPLLDTASLHCDWAVDLALSEGT